ncbi:MAG: ADP-ribosylglycohydrolase family protein [Lentisphaeria bacterium]|nr:ADP-ribosylglycohydrolase family protein [Lentisphaeria bacterium]
MDNYLEQVYAGVLGKVIGVYMGRPVEGLSKDRIAEKVGLVDRYVAEDCNLPLIVADDDITGTFTFIRALKDSGLYAATPEDFFGDMWLDTIIPNKSILWWGGYGHSTEHTAFIRLQQGLRSPESGSIKRNGKVVAEQIGAQIFIDAFGMVCPGDPEKAAVLAKRSAEVSHDGEAVYAAQVVAAMCAAAFEEKDIFKLMDIGIEQVPSDCLIAEIHKDVRNWCIEDGDWHETFKRIDEKYGYGLYGGNCHVIPNHAIMVMAWAYAPDDFFESQLIANSAGWDTDCNAANVGSVMGIKVGLHRICERYDFRSPIGDRVILPTAEGTRAVSDCLTEAREIALIGNKIMGWSDEAVTSKCWHDFAMPGAQHGWMLEGESNTKLSNPDGKGLNIELDLHAEKDLIISTPILAEFTDTYFVDGCPRLYAGTELTFTFDSTDITGNLSAQIFLRHSFDLQLWEHESIELNGQTEISFTIPEDLCFAIADLGVKLISTNTAKGSLKLVQVNYGGKAILERPDGMVIQGLDYSKPTDLTFGWLTDHCLTRGEFSDDQEQQTRLGNNGGRSLSITGTEDWHDTSIECRMNQHLADGLGLIVHYQGRERYVATLQKDNELILFRREYGSDQIIARCESPAWAVDEFHKLKLTSQGSRYIVTVDDIELINAEDSSSVRPNCHVFCGGAGFIFETGLIGLRDLKIYSDLKTQWDK